MDPSTYKFDTLSLHGGHQPDKNFGSRAVPIYQTTSYVFQDTDHAAALFNLEQGGHIYSRISNPTVGVLEERVCALEGGTAAIATASGQSAVYLTIMTLANSGDHIVASSQLYGGTVNLLRLTLPRFGITTTFVKPGDTEGFKKAIKPNTKMIFGEIIGNPGLEIMDIPKAILPRVVSCSEVVGETSVKSIGKQITISGIAGDQQAALFGQLCWESGDVKNTYGTGCFCIMNTGSKAIVSKNKMLTTIGYQIGGETTYAIEGSVFIAGALIQWLRDELSMVTESSQIEALAKTVSDNGGITFLPSLTGLGAPYWEPSATGGILGITRGTKKGHIARAALEAIALRSYELVNAMQKDANTNFTILKVDGGASQNNLLLQIQANVLNTKVVRPEVTETTALGSAFFAGLAVGFWKSREEIQNLWKENTQFHPDQDKTYTNQMISLWNQRIQVVLNKNG